MRRKFFSNWLPPKPYQASALVGCSSGGTALAPPAGEPGGGASASPFCGASAAAAVSAAAASGVEGDIFEVKLLLPVVAGDSVGTANRTLKRVEGRRNVFWTGRQGGKREKEKEPRGKVIKNDKSTDQVNF